jgi:hypothetical protein
MGEHTGSPLPLPSQKNTTHLMMWQNVGAYGIRPKCTWIISPAPLAQIKSIYDAPHEVQIKTDNVCA